MVTFLIISCSDSDDDEPQSLLVNSWNVVKFQSKLPSETEWTDSSNTCTFDDTWEFTTANEVIIFTGSILCEGDTNTINTIIDDYQLAANDTKIIFTVGGFEFEEDIEELTENTLITTYALGTIDNAQGRRIFTKAE